MDELSRALRAELERRDETILALEMLVVDQASRLLALESIVLEAVKADAVDLSAVQRRVAKAAERFRERFEAIDGFAGRAQHIAGEMIGSTGKARAKRAAKSSAIAKPKTTPKTTAKKKSVRR